jgi:hypothetical protein
MEDDAGSIKNQENLVRCGNAGNLANELEQKTGFGIVFNKDSCR